MPSKNVDGKKILLTKLSTVAFELEQRDFFFYFPLVFMLYISWHLQCLARLLRSRSIRTKSQARY